jgi:signal transduction histidine kinase
VALVVELAPELPVVLGDSIQLQQVILNLLMNGIEAMTSVAGRPRQLVVRSQIQGTGLIYVSVQDSGIGLTPEVMIRLFEPFFTTRTKGIGMGLPISRSIVEAHGGSLWAEPAPDHGSVFQFTLPNGSGSSA